MDTFLRMLQRRLRSAAALWRDRGSEKKKGYTTKRQGSVRHSGESFLLADTGYTH